MPHYYTVFNITLPFYGSQKDYFITCLLSLVTGSDSMDPEDSVIMRFNCISL